MPASVELLVRGESLHLHADRALYWPARGRLMIADLHLGKGDVFRRAGIPVPRGGTDHDLARLDALIQHFQARELFVLGDLLHGPVPDAPWRHAWLQWRARHAGLRVAAITGNHDRRLAEAGLQLQLPGDEVRDGPLLLRHEPGPDVDAHVICGHLHPAFAVPGIRPAWPGFWLRESRLVLPAFSAFTGRQRFALAAGEGALLCVDGALVPIGRVA